MAKLLTQKRLKPMHNPFKVILSQKPRLLQHRHQSLSQNLRLHSAPTEPTNSEPAGKEITVEATAYTAGCEGCIGITKTGVDLNANPDAKVIAVDPSIIPLGSKVYVEGYGYATAEDTGGAIKGNRIDVFVPEQNDALQWGRKQVKVTIID